MLNDWHDLFVVTCGAAAALTGLIFVGVSLNLTKILAYETLPNRALLSLVLLLNILVVSILFLIPAQTTFILGLEILVVGILFYIAITKIDISNYRKTDSKYKKQYRIHMTIDQLAIIPYVVAGIAILYYDEKGIYFIVPGIIFSFCKSIFDAWGPCLLK